MDKIDVLVVGGGPAGLSAGLTAAENGNKTVIIEKSKAIGYPIHDSAGSFKETIDKFNLSDKVVANKISGFRFISPQGNSVDVFLEKDVGAILERREVNREMAEKAAKNGAEILINEKVESPIKEDNEIAGVNVSGFNNKKKYYSKIVIDASGVSGKLSKSLGIHPGLKNIRWAQGVQFEMTNVDLEGTELAEIYFGSNIAPGGYGWIFPKGEGLANVGIGLLHGMEKKEKIMSYLQRFIKSHPVSSKRCKNAQPIEYHVGTFPIGPMFQDFTRNNFIAVGDAACQGSPHLGEGIRFSLKCGKIAGDVASEAISEGDTSKKKLSLCETRIRKEVYPNYKLLYKIHKYACSKTDDSWEDTIKKLEKISESDAGRELIKKVMRGDFSKLYLLRTAPKFAMESLANILQ